jgi:hypothetical protein
VVPVVVPVVPVVMLPVDVGFPVVVEGSPPPAPPVFPGGSVDTAPPQAEPIAPLKVATVTRKGGRSGRRLLFACCAMAPRSARGMPGSSRRGAQLTAFRLADPIFDLALDDVDGLALEQAKHERHVEVELDGARPDADRSFEYV